MQDVSYRTGAAGAKVSKAASKRAKEEGDRDAAKLLAFGDMIAYRSPETSDFWWTGDPKRPDAVLIVARLGRPVAGARYLNRYVIWTSLDCRSLGLARLLDETSRVAYSSQGYDRLKTTSGSAAGLRYHLRRGWPVYGANPKGELVHDAPLHAGAPTDAPLEMHRKLGVPHVWSLEEINHHLETNLTHPYGAISV